MSKSSKEKSNLLLDQAASVTWLEMPQSFPPGAKMVGVSKSREFESVKNALRFVMEDLKSASQSSAMIHTDGVADLQIETIRQMYAETKSAS
jgi:hypothetical protein